jgi:hypothetical protein
LAESSHSVDSQFGTPFVRFRPEAAVETYCFSSFPSQSLSL